MAENGGGQKLIAVFPADKVCCLEEDGSPIVPGKSLPCRLSSERSVDSSSDSRRIGFMVGAKMVGVVAWYRLLGNVSCLDL